MKNVILKFIATIGRIILHILIWGLIPLNLFYMDINEWLAIALTVLWIIAVNVFETIIFRKKEKKPKKVGRVLFVLLDLITILLIVVATEFNFYWNSLSFRTNVNWDIDSGNVDLTREQALKDYDYALKYLKKIHPLTLHGLPDDVQAQADKVKAELESVDSIKGYELAQKLESIFSLLEDGHTHVEESYTEYHYMKHIYEHKSAGDTLIGINGVTFEEFLQENPGYVSYEVESYGVRMLKNRIGSLEGLRYLGIDTSGEITYNYETKDGELIDVTVTADDFLVYDEYIAYEESVTGEDLHSVDEDYDFVRYEIDEEESFAVLTLDSCDYNQHYRDVVAAMFEEVHEKNIQNIAVDLTNNSGGSSMVCDEFIHYLDVDKYSDWADEVRMGPLLKKRDASIIENKKKGYGFSGNVFVITSVTSYSSAMDFAMLIQDNEIGKVVGEASGNMPASYGEIAYFLLPESGLYMQISSKKWHRVDQSKEGLQILPDIECDPNNAVDVLKEMYD